MKIPKKSRWVLILNKNNEKELTSLSGLYFLEAEQEDLNYRALVQTSEINDGEVPISNFFDPFTLKLLFYFKGRDEKDLNLLVQELRQELAIRNSYYVVHSDLPMFKYPCNQASFEIERINNSDAKISISFRVFKGYKESLPNTLSAQLIDNNWGFGMGLEMQDLSYTHETKSFDIFNAGLEIDPRLQHTLKIAFSGIVTNKLTIYNQTTDDSFIYNGNLNKNNILLLDGVYPLVDGARCGKNTNNGIVRLAKGNNSIKIEGANDFKISFAFHFLYR
ncbi:phage tail family protein [Listeria welshimeri]|nr:phage tail family protein [Listeria welshimeri]MBC1962651.1 phage tail family protein [Listeria welshimeri]